MNYSILSTEMARQMVGIRQKFKHDGGKPDFVYLCRSGEDNTKRTVLLANNGKYPDKRNATKCDLAGRKWDQGSIYWTIFLGGQHQVVKFCPGGSFGCTYKRFDLVKNREDDLPLAFSAPSEGQSVETTTAATESSTRSNQKEPSRPTNYLTTRSSKPQTLSAISSDDLDTIFSPAGPPPQRVSRRPQLGPHNSKSPDVESVVVRDRGETHRSTKDRRGQADPSMSLTDQGDENPTNMNVCELKSPQLVT